MPPDLAEAAPCSPPHDFPPPQSSHLAHHNPLKRNLAPLSVRLRSKPSKRLKLSSKTEDKAEAQPRTTHSHSIVARVLSRTKNLPSVNPKSSESVRRAKAEEWFNDTNKNVSHAQRAAFPDGTSCRSVTVSCRTNCSQTIHRFTFFNNRRQILTAPARYRLISQPNRAANEPGLSVRHRPSCRGWSPERVPARNSAA